MAAQDVRYNFDQDADFSKFKTYEWVSIKSAAQVDEITAKQITQAIDSELAKKGLTKTDSDNADLFVGDCHRYRKAAGGVQHRMGIWTRQGSRVVRIPRRDGNVDRNDCDDLYGEAGPGHVPGRKETAHLAG